MNALSRREEDSLLKATKAYALKQCDPVVKGASLPRLPTIVLTDVKQNLRIACPGV
ncbi:hypothetical protein DFS33DRAFT_1302988 [Desarmillaria ectypa]|nr:hypothetical protein DFS33DRAFT_1302988 [Desarmillaria ectypa]